MVAFDQHRHPMRFAVAASTVSGLLVVSVTAVLDRALRPGIITGSAIGWVLAAVGWTVATASLVLWARRRRPRRVFFIVAAFNQKHWVAELIRDLHENLEKRGHDLVLKLPGNDYSAISQSHLLERILSHRHDYAGGLIMANESEAMARQLTRFCDRAGMPVVFVDAEPFETEDAYPSRTAWVGYHDLELGAAAALWAADYLRGEGRTRPSVLVVNGGCYAEREQQFREVLRASLPDAQLHDVRADFDRSLAREAARKHVLLLAARKQTLDLVFCTNDEMALGVADALPFADKGIVSKTVIVGVDGTPQARALIESGPGQLRATVEQDPWQVAEAAADLLDRMIRGEKVAIRTRLSTRVLD